MPRYMLTEELWSKLKEILLQFSLYDKAGLRRTVEGILFRIRTGIPWRNLPEHFGKWNSIYKAFNHWSKKGIWKKLFSGLTTDSDLKWVFIDGRYVRLLRVVGQVGTGIVLFQSERTTFQPVYQGRVVQHYWQ